MERPPIHLVKCKHYPPSHAHKVVQRGVHGITDLQWVIIDGAFVGVLATKSKGNAFIVPAAATEGIVLGEAKPGAKARAARRTDPAS